MAYADQQVSTRKIVSLTLVVLLHAALGYAFISGLAYNVVKKVAQDLNTFDVEDEPPPPPEAPPPPPPQPQQVQPPPVVAPPPIVQVQTAAPPPMLAPPPPPVVIHQEAPPAPPPPPPPPQPSKAAEARGNPGSWVTTDDYPPSAIRDGIQGTSQLTFDINPQGRIENCRVTASSGSPLLDDTACKLVVRRGRYSPALDQAGNPMSGGTKTLRFTWRLPE
ncbi:energy transducer TonB [Sphingomonas quercus]|uniref:Energy transducer TonB n=1 Tax=Sphingomonas quercus TaxID=2842451 RepID=A0ABS6BJ14_9SPHN|nr:energy transducer TonB [Sphingomonas quercus]MBU3078169.1 energy transducer TonB [Sphingomonas quercus]